MGWVFLYAGIVKVLDPGWSAAGYLLNAKTFSGFYAWFAGPSILPAVNAINEWSLVLLGVSLLLGLFVRVSSVLGIVLMTLYYLPVLDFPYVGHYLLIDDHIVFILILALLIQTRAGRILGLENWCSRLPICSRVPALRRLLG